MKNKNLREKNKFYLKIKNKYFKKSFQIKNKNLPEIFYSCKITKVYIIYYSIIYK